MLCTINTNCYGVTAFSFNILLLIDIILLLRERAMFDNDTRQTVWFLLCQGDVFK